MIKRNLGSMAMGLAEAVIGIMLLADPTGSASGAITTLGIALMIVGIGKTVRYFRTEPEEAAFSQLLVKGLCMLLAGAVCVFDIVPVTQMYGLVILVTGITKLQWTTDIIRMKRSKWVWTGIGAAIAILCGITVILSPFGTPSALWWFLGISLIAEAVFDMLGGIFGNREKKADEA